MIQCEKKREENKKERKKEKKEDTECELNALVPKCTTYLPTYLLCTLLNPNSKPVCKGREDGEVLG